MKKNQKINEAKKRLLEFSYLELKPKISKLKKRDKIWLKQKGWQKFLPFSVVVPSTSGEPRVAYGNYEDYGYGHSTIKPFTLTQQYLQDYEVSMTNPLAPPKEKKQRAMSERQYNKWLEETMSNMQDMDHSEIHDVAESVMYESGVKEYILKHYFNGRAKKQDIVEKLTDDLSNYAM